MNWLICGISSLIMSACFAPFIMVAIKEKQNVAWLILYSFFAGVNFLSGVTDFLLRISYSPKTVVINVVCCVIMVLMAFPFFVKKLKEQKRDR